MLRHKTTASVIVTIDFLYHINGKGRWVLVFLLLQMLNQENDYQQEAKNTLIVLATTAGTPFTHLLGMAGHDPITGCIEIEWSELFDVKAAGTSNLPTSGHLSVLLIHQKRTARTCDSRCPRPVLPCDPGRSKWGIEGSPPCRKRRNVWVSRRPGKRASYYPTAHETEGVGEMHDVSAFVLAFGTQCSLHDSRFMPLSGKGM